MKREEFWTHIEKTPRCWNWMPSLKQYGADFFSFEGTPMKAQRASWIIANGPVPPDNRVLIKCNNPYCVNPEHLYLSTNKVGRVNHRAKLDGMAVHHIQMSHYSNRELSKRYKVSRAQISRIKNGKSWGWMREDAPPPPPDADLEARKQEAAARYNRAQRRVADPLMFEICEGE